MSRILVTGSQGKIGSAVTAALAQEGHEVRSFDLAASQTVPWEHIPGDVLDGVQVRRACMGCDRVVHLAAIPVDRRGASDSVFHTNITGTWNVLQAAMETGVSRVVFFSSSQALGITAGDRKPDYLPINDAHPAHPRPAYGLSKFLGEEMCSSFSAQYGLSTLCLRPVFVSTPDDYRRWKEFDRGRMRRWLVGDKYSYVDIRDVAAAVVNCLKDGVTAQHGRYLLVADDNSAGLEIEDLLREDFPDVPWTGSSTARSRPRGSLFDTSAAQKDFGWIPKYSWQDED
ncbi:MAG: NAD(P)-dependent oxidoreductase [Armatimonadota bacterium]|nr:NAD(P)-dependent oxidoreductase [Armatimonadota bacterium]